MSQPLASTVQPTDIYGGDEIAALVLDPGYCYTRAGFAGEDVPKSVLPSWYGYVGSTSPPTELFGEDHIIARRDIEVRNYMSRDSIIEDWDVATHLWERMLVKSLHAGRPTPPSRNGLNDDLGDGLQHKQQHHHHHQRDEQGDIMMGDSNGNGSGAAGYIAAHSGNEADSVDGQEKSLDENPLLLSEAPWNTAKAREKTIEVIMENWTCPAIWISRTSVLAAFAAGKATALVVDVGGANTSVTAIHDGVILKKSIQRSPVGGLWMSSQVRSLFGSSNPKIDIVAGYQIQKKVAVEAGAPAQIQVREFDFPITDSFRAYQEESVLSLFKESVAEVWHHGGKYNSAANEEWSRSQAGPVFEMPDGSNQMWREQRFRVAEGMWDHTAQLPVGDDSAITAAQTIPEIIRAALNSVDVDLRPNLLANIVVTGGGSLVRGFNERLNMETSAMYPSMRIKIQSAGLTTERRFGSFIGGSILASLGTFHQMWVSRKEYEENGAGIVEKRCK